MASQITTLRIVYWTVYSRADQRKHQSSASLAFVWGTHRWPVNSPHKGPVTRKMFPLDDVIMRRIVTTRYEECIQYFYCGQSEFLYLLQLTMRKWLKIHISDFTLDVLSDTLYPISALRGPTSIPNNVLLKNTEAWVWARSYKTKS